MTKSTAFVMLSAIAFFSQSFKPAETVQQPITAQVGGQNFDLNAGNTYTAQLTGGKTAVLTFNGATPAQKINVAYKINEVGDILVKGISYELDGKKFESLPEATSMNVSKFEWSSDKKSFVLSAAFDCKAQSEGAFQANDDAIAIKGNIQDVVVNVSSSDMATISE